MDTEYNLEDIPIQFEDVDVSQLPETSNNQIEEKSSSSEASSGESSQEASSSKEKSRKSYVRKDISKLPQHLKGLMGEANLRYARGDLETAKKMCFEVIRQAREAYEPYLTLSQIYETSNPKKCKAYLMLAAHLAPSNKSIAYRLAEVFLQEGELDEAIKCYSRIIKCLPKNMKLHQKRLELLKQKEEKKMLLIAKQTMANNISKKHYELIINLAMEVAKEHFAQKNYVRAIEALKVPIRRIPERVTKDLINMILELLLINERYSECLDIFTQFCGFTFDISLTEGHSIIMHSYDIPENLEIDLKVQFIICLIKLRAEHLFPQLINKLLIEDDVELYGDLYIDIVEALMLTNYTQEALKLLIPLIKSKKYSLAAVWLKYAECLTACQMSEQAIEAYFTVMAMAPAHVEILYPLAMLLLQQNKKQEALEVLSQDLNSNKLDIAVLLEQLKLLKQINHWEAYWKSVELLLSRHCIVLKHHEEMRVVLTQYSIKEKTVNIKRMRNFRSENCDTMTDVISIREPSAEDEYKAYRGILQTALDRKKYGMLQKFAFAGLSSKRFCQYFFEISLVAAYGSYLNNDTNHAYIIIKDFLQRHPKNKLFWNFYNIIIATPDGIRHPRFLERSSARFPDEARKLLIALHNVSIGNSINAMNFFVKELKKSKTPFNAFMLGLAMFQYTMQKGCDKSQKNVLVETVTYLFLHYAKTRSKKAEQEICYNLGRLYHQMGFMHLAENYYRKVFKVSNRLLELYPNILDLRQEAAYNLHIIYKNSGNYIAARKILFENIVI